MIRKTIFSLALLLASFTAFSIRAYFDYKQFYLPGEGPYVECILSFDGSSMRHKAMEDGSFQASAESTLIILKEGKIIDFRKSVTEGPLANENEHPDLLSLERFMLAPGKYQLEIQLRDLNDPEGKVEKLQQDVEINLPSTSVFMSDIELISAYTPTTTSNAFSKSGYDMLPYITNHYPREFGVMVFYNEVYNTETWIGPNTPFVVKVSVFAEDGKLVESVGRIKKYNSASIVPVFQTLDIASLSSGNYLLCEEIKDKNNNTITTRYLKFTRSFDAVETNSEDFQLDGTFVSQFTNADSLYEIIRCHLPISTTLERTSIDNVLLLKDMDQLKSFLFTFWQTRNPANPESEWKQYMEKVAYTDKSFGNKIKRGWQTDRGRVYLQYGKPNTRIERHYNPDYYPFEIWHYYETNGLHNCKFLFVNPSMSNDFELIHTDNLPMEIRQADWQRLVRTGLNDQVVGTGRDAFNQKDRRTGDELEDLWYNPH